MKTFYFYFLVAVLQCGPLAVNSDGLTNFIELKMADFPNWIVAHDLDPSPRLSGPTIVNTSNFQDPNLEGELYYHGAQGYSTADLNVHYVRGSLEELSFTVLYEFEDHIRFSGGYNITILTHRGSSNNSYGDWYIHSNLTIFQYTIPFAITSDGFVNISNPERSVVVIHGNSAETYFENMWRDPDIDMTLRGEFQKILRTESSYPFHQIQLRYLKEIFEETPVSEIIGTTLYPPTTTEETSTSSSTTRVTTTTKGPCQAWDEALWQSSGGTNIMNGTVLSQYVSLDAYGNPVKKRLIVIEETID